MTGSHSLVRSSHFFYVLPIARPRAFGISDCHVRFWSFPPRAPKRTADIDVFVELCKQVPGQFHDPVDFSQPLAFEIFCMSETPRYGHVMAIWDIIRSSAYILIKKKLFRGLKVGTQIRISKVSFDMWLDGENLATHDS